MILTRNKPKIGVYAITCVVTRKRYIGATLNLYDRFANHKAKLRHNCHKSQSLQQEWNQFGESAFVFDVLQYFATKEEAEAAERKMILAVDDVSMIYNKVVFRPKPVPKGRQRNPSPIKRKRCVYYLDDDLPALLTRAAKKRNMETSYFVSELLRAACEA